MAGSSLLALIDDIASLLDDIATMTKVATKKTAGVLGDDLALNAEQVTGVTADRELPVVWAVFKGAAINKAILVPAAVAISAIAPWAVIPLLMLGGGFLCFEGAEKVLHRFFHAPAEAEAKAAEKTARKKALADPAVDMVAFEKKKVKGAIRTDFILSAEIIVIALGTVAAEPLMTRFGVLIAVAILVNVVVYGLVAGIVKLDDVGLALSKKEGGIASLGRGIVAAAPWLMKGLSVLGTIAMFLVGGGIIAHGIPGGEQFVHDLAANTGGAAGLVATLINGVIGVIAGLILVGIITPIQRALGRDH